ncbi:MAG: biotin--[Bacteroidales bacterium]|nr:biotin--[acetyl-CoA-carboxylase] ligase [Bacteroidales bacterium]MBQ7818996.1 biotin--[acetyl-CoA-carboxylase] ligase [Bacteroidales bacterium]
MINHIHYNVTQSTNSDLKRLLSEDANLPHLTVVSTAFQTSGRGQRENSWESENGKNLLFSLLLRPISLKATEAFAISRIVSVAIAKFLRKYISDVSIKWPNDIYWRDKKICGILIENSIMGEYLDTSIVGVGLNINQREFSQNLPNPVSLTNITGKEFLLDKVLTEVVTSIEEEFVRYFENRAKETESIYHQLIYRLDTKALYKVAEVVVEAEIQGVCSDGRLILKHSDGNLRYYAFKEVTYML